MSKGPEPDDPMERIGVEVHASSAVPEEGCEMMGRAFIEEFAEFGWGPERLLALFRNPFYQGPHGVYRSKGEAFVKRLISEYMPGRIRHV
jgi:hypothetical protein